MKIRLAVFSLLMAVSCAFSAFAGDVASFVNLGFSDDSGYFMFGFHGTDGDTARPFAEIYTVDVKANAFVSGGTARESFGETLQPGQDSGGALYTLLGKNIPLVQKFRIKHLRQGRLLYILLNGDSMKSSLEFRDFTTQNLYSAELIQNTTGSGSTVKSAFSIKLAITQPSGASRSYTLGRPDYYREKVMGYRIRQIFLSPDEKNLVCVVERDQYSASGKSVRYMVETIKLN
ncbi:MAG: DUF2259 domain-containing protein [Spirochaetaceae bacterium]|nr:DUF2259 domain-containing protein [Spirochaetaceae bacterium]